MRPPCGSCAQQMLHTEIRHLKMLSLATQAVLARSQAAAAAPAASDVQRWACMEFERERSRFDDLVLHMERLSCCDHPGGSVSRDGV